MQIIQKIFRPRTLVGRTKRLALVSFCLALITTNAVASDVERPFIWATKAERGAILTKISTQPWAKSLYKELKHRVELRAVGSLAKRAKVVKELPLLWFDDKSRFPTLPIFRVKTGGGTNAQLTAVVKSLQDAIDCGVLYYLTKEKHYATCGADTLHTFIHALKQRQYNISGDMNAGWLFPSDHLYEARVIGAQLPIIYDFVYPYLKAGGKVYDVVSGQEQSFDFELAQKTFKTYIWLALNKGLFDSNWPVLESSSLVHNILALDSQEEINKYLPYYTHVNTKNQASLTKVYEHFKNEGDIWPESFQYSRHVAGFTVYLMTLLDRYDPTLQLGKKFPNVPGAFTAYYNLEYPNTEYPYIGDGHRSYQIDYADLENSLLLAKLNGNKRQEKYFSNYLMSSIKAGVYDRGHLHRRGYGAAPYYTPLQLLWSVDEINGVADVDVAPPRPRSLRLEYAGMNIQRLVDDKNPRKNSLMAFIAGGSYIHGHASGMDMELYGQGHVLGVDGGKGSYRSDIHENYYRLFAAHNSVISNGASASKGDWINLGIERVKSLSAEPVAGQAGVSPYHAFMTSSFYDKHNLVAPAQHQRTLALIKVSDTKGYYLDVFRAKSDIDNQFHDYLYHNIGDQVTISSQNNSVALTDDDNRYQASAKLEWITTGQRGYRHPGWHFFDDVKTKEASAQQYEATFTASMLGNKAISMRAIIPAGLAVDITQAKAPPAYGASTPYNKKPLPTFVLRHQGEAWSNPYAIAYESKTADENYAVQSVERIMEKGIFKGVKVGLNVEGQEFTQYVLVQENINDLYQDKDTGIYFQGEFAVITLDCKQKVTEIYLGKGRSVKFNGRSLKAKKSTNSAYVKF